MVYFPIYIHSSSVLKKKMLELKKEMCKHLAENSFNADDADACFKFKCLSHAVGG